MPLLRRPGLSRRTCMNFVIIFLYIMSVSFTIRMGFKPDMFNRK